MLNGGDAIQINAIDLCCAMMVSRGVDSANLLLSVLRNGQRHFEVTSIIYSEYLSISTDYRYSHIIFQI